VQDRPSVGPLGRGGEPDQDLRPQVAQQRVVGVGCGVVELVDHHHVVSVGRELAKPLLVQRLDRGEDVPAEDRLLAAGELLAEVAVADGDSEGGE
jgi:hypothetical protein